MIFTDESGQKIKLVKGDVVKLADGRTAKITNTEGVVNFVVLEDENVTRSLIQSQEINVLQIEDIVEIVKLAWTLWRAIKKIFVK
jgi:hypothetical protein